MSWELHKNLENSIIALVCCVGSKAKSARAPRALTEKNSGASIGLGEMLHSSA
jgi:hypothetical protein